MRCPLIFGHLKRDPMSLHLYNDRLGATPTDRNISQRHLWVDDFPKNQKQMGTGDLIPRVQSLILRVQSLILRVQSLILRVQSLILRVQSLILRVQSLILRVQSLILRVQSLILRVQSLILRVQSLILRVQSLILRVQSLILRVQSLILRVQSLILRVQSLILREGGIHLLDHTPPLFRMHRIRESQPQPTHASHEMPRILGPGVSRSKLFDGFVCFFSFNPYLGKIHVLTLSYMFLKKFQKDWNHHLVYRHGCWLVANEG